MEKELNLEGGFEEVVNGQRRQEMENQKAAEEKKIADERQERIDRFHQKRLEHRKERVEIQAFRYSCGALAAGVVAYFTITGGIVWLGCVTGATAAILGVIACFGFGRAHELGQ